MTIQAATRPPAAAPARPPAHLPATGRATLGRTVAVASGKGGVGKTWFAATLAHALARRGRRVLLFDADLGLANVDIQLGLTPRHDLGAVAFGTVTMAQAVERFVPGGQDTVGQDTVGQGGAGFDVLAGSSGSGALSALDAAGVERLLAALAATAAGYDHVLLDLGAGLDRAVRRMSAWADTLLVIATEEPTSLTDAYAALKLHAADRPGGDAKLVVNQVSSPAAGARTAAALERAYTAFLGRAPALAGFVRRDQHVGDAIRRQAPLLTRYPNCPASVDVERIAGALLGA